MLSFPSFLTTRSKLPNPGILTRAPYTSHSKLSYYIGKEPDATIVRPSFFFNGRRKCNQATHKELIPFFLFIFSLLCLSFDIPGGG